MQKTTINNVEVYLSHPDELNISIVGAFEVRKQIKACWLVLEEDDLPLTPRIIGVPGVGKTTLAYAVGKELGKEVYIYQCTMDTRPEDLIITPVIEDDRRIKYHASPLVTAMLRGGVAILDEGNRMSEKAWASLAPLLDNRRYVESVTAGIKIKAHPDFRCCVTMNDDSSTFEVPEYIMSRLQPVIYMDFPNIQEEKEILKINLPYAEDKLINMMAAFLSRAHEYEEPFTSRDGINILRYTLRMINQDQSIQLQDALRLAIYQILGGEAINYLNPDYKPGYMEKKGPQPPDDEDFFFNEEDDDF